MASYNALFYLSVLLTLSINFLLLAISLLIASIITFRADDGSLPSFSSKVVSFADN